MYRVLLQWLVASGLMASVALGASLNDLQDAFTAHRATANSHRDEQLGKLDASYVGALQRQLEKVKATGKLETAIPFNDEIQAVKKGLAPLPPLTAAAISELRNMRGKYLESRDKILKEHAGSVVPLSDKMERELKSQEIALTKDGKLEEALAAKRLREALAGDADILAARDLVKYSGQSGNGPAAYQLRRYGDNLEVLVFRDRSGNVSMDSPVVNVREKTAPKKELGNTSAKVLGEFVGAKGYRADPYVAYHHVFDGIDAGRFVWSEIIPAFKQTEAGEKGQRLSLKALAANPHGSLADVLPPTASKGTYRISCRYFIPKSNRAVNGFIFVHGAGAAIANHTFDKVGKWDTAEITGESTQASRDMLVYLSIPQAKKELDPTGDAVVLGELKIEYLGFSAFVQQKFGDHGEPLNGSDDPQKQTLLISNGQFVKE